jgi:aminoglycoside phosphotransferase (APT) family kinase protein
MTVNATWACGAAFCKRYPTAEAAELARALCTAARNGGVPTPAVWQSAEADVLCFDRIEACGAASLKAMVATLTVLRQMPKAALGRFDPFVRIRPRLQAAPSAMRALVENLAARDAALAWPAAAVVHGDFHPGQVIRDQTGKVWLIDLDDLALAPAEADLGNLAAWIATQKPGHLGGAAADALVQVLSVASGADPRLTAHFLDVALIRRALKLQEKGVDWVVRQLSVRA